MEANIILVSIFVVAVALAAAVAISPEALDAVADKLRRQSHAMRAFYRARQEWDCVVRRGMEGDL